MATPAAVAGRRSTLLQGFSGSREVSAPAPGREKGKRFLAPPRRWGPHSPDTAPVSTSTSGNGFRGGIEQGHFHSSCFCFAFLLREQQGLQSQPGTTAGRAQSPTNGSDSARRVRADPVDSQRELPKPSGHLVLRWLPGPETPGFVSLRSLLVQPHCVRGAGLLQGTETGKRDSPSDRGRVKPRLCSWAQPQRVPAALCSPG